MSQSPDCSVCPWSLEPSYSTSRLSMHLRCCAQAWGLTALSLLPFLLCVRVHGVGAVAATGHGRLRQPQQQQQQQQPREAGAVGSSNLWVVIVGTSRNWLNYRDNSNALGLYRTVRALGVPDHRIILMLGHSMACDARNSLPGQLYGEAAHAYDLYREPLEVDYRGADVTVDNFLRVLVGRHAPGTPLSRQLQSDAHSEVLIYLTGHGGDKFLKFQDKEELQANDLANAIHQMHVQQRYGSILLLIDTCQADTLGSEIVSPGVVALSSSVKGENSYARSSDFELGVSLADRFTDTALDFVRRAVSGGLPRNVSLQRLFHAFDKQFMMSTPSLRADHFALPLDSVPTLNFFQYAAPVTLSPSVYPLRDEDLASRAKKCHGKTWQGRASSASAACKRGLAAPQTKGDTAAGAESAGTILASKDTTAMSLTNVQEYVSCNGLLEGLQPLRALPLPPDFLLGLLLTATLLIVSSLWPRFPTWS